MQGVERDSGDAKRGRSQDLPLKGPQPGMRDGHCATRSLQGRVPVTVVGHSGGCVGERGVKEAPPVKGDLGRGLADGGEDQGQGQGKVGIPSMPLPHAGRTLMPTGCSPDTDRSLQPPAVGHPFPSERHPCLPLQLVLAAEPLPTFQGRARLLCLPSTLSILPTTVLLPSSIPFVVYFRISLKN